MLDNGQTFHEYIFGNKFGSPSYRGEYSVIASDGKIYRIQYEDIGYGFQTHISVASKRNDFQNILKLRKQMLLTGPPAPKLPSYADETPSQVAQPIDPKLCRSLVCA